MIKSDIILSCESEYEDQLFDQNSVETSVAEESIIEYTAKNGRRWIIEPSSNHFWPIKWCSTALIQSVVTGVMIVETGFVKYIQKQSKLLCVIGVWQ